MKRQDVESTIKVYETRDYDIFKRLDGNRAIKDGRVKKIIDSIMAVGYLPVPVIVNEKYEIIDGQGRIEACRKTEEPVYYIKVPKIGIEECISMNINQANWKVMDYIESYAERGVRSYQYLLKILDNYQKYYKQRTVLYAIFDKTPSGKGLVSDIKNGSILIDQKTYDRARVALSWLISVKDAVEYIGGHTEYYYMALLYCYRRDDIDNERLIEKVKKEQLNLLPVTGMLQALDQLEAIYNYRIGNGKKVYIATEYKKDLDERKTA